jgi:hypothetical protein
MAVLRQRDGPCGGRRCSVCTSGFLIVVDGGKIRDMMYIKNFIIAVSLRHGLLRLRLSSAPRAELAKRVIFQRPQPGGHGGRTCGQCHSLGDALGLEEREGAGAHPSPPSSRRSCCGGDGDGGGRDVGPLGDGHHGPGRRGDCGCGWPCATRGRHPPRRGRCCGRWRVWAYDTHTPAHCGPPSGRWRTSGPCSPWPYVLWPGRGCPGESISSKPPSGGSHTMDNWSV